jgi:hypothetical protein
LCQRLFKKKGVPAIVIAVVILIVAALLFFFLSDKQDYKEIGIDEAKAKSEDFINNFLMPSGSKATITETSEEYDLYKMKIDIGSESPVESYVSKDGKLFFPQAINMEKTGQETANTDSAQNTPATPTDIPKNDKPVVELFVMSYCPYGTQIEKGMLPVIEALGNKIDFKLKFCDYAMHEKKELDENLVQYCIQKEQPEKLAEYLTCFLAESKGAECLAKVANKNKIEKCVDSTDKEFKVSANYASKTDWRGTFPGFNVDKADNDKYSVGGSPTLIINGKEVQSGRDSASLLNTICAAFNNAPEECSQTLNSQSPTPGFGFDYSAASGAAASCN